MKTRPVLFMVLSAAYRLGTGPLFGERMKLLSWPKKIRVIIGSVLLAAGLAIFLWDTYVTYRYGFGINDLPGNLSSTSDEAEPEVSETR